MTRLFKEAWDAAGKAVKPRVSCICITQNRRHFLRRAVRQYHRSRIIGSELVVLDGSDEPLGASICTAQGDPDIRYVHEPSPPHAKTGALHNRACELARGDIIIQWDDDDWQSPNRITEQLWALAGARTHASKGIGSSPSDPPEKYPNGAFAFTSKFWWYHLGERRACKARSWERQDGSAGATFAYHRKVWEAAPFRDDVDQGEDNFFWDDHRKRGTPMIDMADPSLLVYIRHNRNGSPAVSDAYTDEDTEQARDVMGVDVDFYDELSEILPLDECNNPHARWRQQPSLTTPFAMWRRRI